VQSQLRITVRDTAHPVALDDGIRRTAAKLEQYCSRVTAAGQGVGDE